MSTDAAGPPHSDRSVRAASFSLERRTYRGFSRRRRGRGGLARAHIGRRLELLPRRRSVSATVSQGIRFRAHTPPDPARRLMESVGAAQARPLLPRAQLADWQDVAFGARVLAFVVHAVDTRRGPSAVVALACVGRCSKVRLAPARALGCHVDSLTDLSDSAGAHRHYREAVGFIDRSMRRRSCSIDDCDSSQQGASADARWTRRPSSHVGTTGSGPAARPSNRDAGEPW